jgi:uncharacterized protein (DUF1330 family)
MPVYMLIEIKVLDDELYTRYAEKVPEIVKKHGGRYLVQGGKVIPMFGNWNPERIVLIEFETEEKLRNCFNSVEYLKIASFRENSTITKSVIVNG